MGKLTELSFLADLYHVDVFMIQETWLDASIQNISLPNFHVLCEGEIGVTRLIEEESLFSEEWN